MLQEELSAVKGLYPIFYPLCHTTLIPQFVLYRTNELNDVLSEIVKATGCDLTRNGRVVLARDTRCELCGIYDNYVRV